MKTLDVTTHSNFMKIFTFFGGTLKSVDHIYPGGSLTIPQFHKNHVFVMAKSPFCG